ncbi:HPr(Ser) kinase/phosphatase [Abyssisolibacter fermentans]|uniref:HPr(Ser) kinase/phosphatase n=1 Tax=Abyssisolibacter fermentans TaxID=1766203 RepID=UPI00082E5995|nr:HPr(Ser) kinase/phosphatase [Abyssisolibacter fermentans]
MGEVDLNKLIKDLNLEILYKGENIETKITKSDINRPGLQIAGYYKYFSYDRIQVMGNAEWYYLNEFENELKFQRLEKLMSYPIPALIMTRGLNFTSKAIDIAKKHNTAFLRTDMPTTKFISKLTNYLEDILAPCITMHGVLVEVYGIGMLILGKSGVGKSETALELIKRGHRLVADDAVEIKQEDEGILKGRAPEIIKHLIEIRGIGILDVKRLYGVGSIRNSKTIDLIVELEYWNKNKEYDRLGLDDEYMEILNTKLTKLTLPIKPGRNVAMILEVAAMNHRQKHMGYNAAVEFNKRLINELTNK